MVNANTVGVALTRCYFCGEGDRIILNTRLTERCADNVREMHDKVLDMEPCQKCADYMKQGVILITIDSDKSGSGWDKPGEGKIPNPYRTGGFFVLRDAAVTRIFPAETAEWALKHRFVFVEHEAAVKLGLFTQRTCA